MATSQIQLTRSGTTGAKPAPGELALGELALNYADGKLYYKNTSNQVIDINNIYDTSNGVVYVNDIDNHVGINTTAPAFALDIGGSTASVDNTLRIHQTDDGTAIRIGAGGSNSDVTLIRVDGSVAVSDGTSDTDEYGFSIKYLGAESDNNNKFAIMSDDSAGDDTPVMAFQILQDGTIGMSKGTTFAPNTTVTLDVEDDIQVTGTGPTLRLRKTDGDDESNESRISIGTNTTLNALEFQTYETDTNTFVSNDYRIEKDADGAAKHEFRTGDINRAIITDAGLGLGTDHEPQRSLDVKGNGAIIRGTLYLSDGSNSEALAEANSNMGLFGTRVGTLDTLHVYSNDRIVFRVSENNEDGEILVLDENGDTITAPNLDTTAIDAGGDKSLVTKEYVTSRINDFIPNIAQAISDKRMLSSQDLPAYNSALTAAFWPSNLLKETTDDRNWSDINEYPLYVSITPRRNNSKFRITVNATGGVQGDDGCGIIVSYNTGSYSSPGVPSGLNETVVGNDEGTTYYRGVTLQLGLVDDGSDSYEASGSWSGLWSPSISAGTTINFFLSLVALNDDNDRIMFNSAYTTAASGHRAGTYPTNIMVEEIYTE